MNHYFLLILMTTVISQEDLRFTYVHKQGFDTSCGIATIATLLSEYWNIPVKEEGLFEDMAGSETAVYTINFFAMSEYLDKHDILTRAFRMNWDELIDTLGQGFAPIIIHYDRPEQHFALLLHIEGENAIVADPAKGLEFINKEQFTKKFSGNVLLAASRTQQKNDGYLQQAINEKLKSIERLNQISRIQRRRW
jgi:ABC-type bacteriocin/lantibiotic exporter with double-glycine peptidase domain